MPAQVRELIVFMASPSDLEDERSIIRVIEDHVNRAFEASGVRVRVLGWELTTPGYGRPQAQINPMVEQCDVFIGLLNRRWGSETGEFSSGFEEEFEIALARRENGEMPAIAMFFAELPADLIADPGPQLTKVLEFKSRIQRERLALYQEFRSTDNLATLVLAFLANQVFPLAMSMTAELNAQGESGADLRETDNRGGPAAATASDGKRAPAASESDLEPALRQLSEMFRAFDSLIWGRPVDGHLDSDRLALIGRSFETQPHAMGAHLVNRLYSRRKDLALARPEMDLWLRTFFADVGTSDQISQRTVPAWDILRRYTSSEESFDKRLAAFAADSDGNVARGAIRVMTRLGRRPASLWPELLEGSSTNDQKQGVVVAVEDGAAVEAWIGMFKALPGVDATFDYLVSRLSDRTGALLSAIAANEDLDKTSRDAVLSLIAARQGDFAGLADLAPSSYSRDADGLTTFLAQHFRDIPAQALDRLSRFGKPELRRLAIKRQLDEADVSEKFIKDVLAWKDDEALQLLLDKVGSTPALGEATLAIVTKDAAKYADGMEARLLAALRTPEELKAMHSASPFNDDAWEALTILLGSEMLDEAREILDTDALAVRDRLTAVVGEHLSLIPYFAGKYRAAACALIGERSTGSAEDLVRVAREVERKDHVSRGPALLALSRITTADTAPVVDEVLTTLDDYSFTRDLPKLLESSLAGILVDRWRSSEVLALREAADRWFLEQPERTESELTAAIYSADSESRITALGNLLRRLEPSQVEALLETYPQGEGTHWYNVTAALDEHLFAPSRQHSDGDPQLPDLVSADTAAP
ncbi:DUF4062 domain-containing protein [Arthrobacter sp. NPDC058130]|uniref:DUF4062 domain-containing protein n=1 Tax=Arthrobacter sp. NPDC058130 TaxID=3346353 RepID=UPI0036E23F80